MKTAVKQRARDLLSSVKLRRTSPRVAILGVLLDAERPLTQDQISIELGGAAPDKVTIYRALESFVGAGLVHRAFLHGRVWHFELAGDCTEEQCHPHFTCTNCGDTHCFTGVSMPMAKSPEKGFVIDRQRIQLEGSCPKCNPSL
ncbi:MAG: Fur family transcriptional regulator [Planctomycetota bacterium]|jgi:Fur family ferric uptake transcriptional regulator